MRLVYIVPIYGLLVRMENLNKMFPEDGETESIVIGEKLLEVTYRTKEATEYIKKSTLDKALRIYNAGIGLIFAASIISEIINILP